jgi:hypothetical protein
VRGRLNQWHEIDETADTLTFATNDQSVHSLECRRGLKVNGVAVCGSGTDILTRDEDPYTISFGREGSRHRGGDT